MKKIFLITVGFFSCAAGQNQVPLELDKAFYDIKCDKEGVLTIAVRSHYCEKTGLYSINAKATTTTGKTFNVFLENENKCASNSIWSKELSGYRCNTAKDIRSISVTAYVDPIIWKPALDAEREARAK